MPYLWIFFFKKKQVISYIQFLENLEIYCNDFIIKTETYDNHSCPVEKGKSTYRWSICHILSMDKVHVEHTCR
jgi:hypothetical protein